MKTPPQGPQPTLRARAIRLLARREHSRAELAKKLGNNVYGAGDDQTIESLDSVLDQLEACGLLSDARAAEVYVRGHAARFGTAKLRHSLRARGIAGELIDACLGQAGIDDEWSRAAAVWRGKFSARPHDVREWARQARFLQGRGFSADIIRKLLAAPPADEE